MLSAKAALRTARQVSHDGPRKYGPNRCLCDIAAVGEMLVWNNLRRFDMSVDFINAERTGVDVTRLALDAKNLKYRA